MAKKVKDNAKLGPVGRLGKTVSAVDAGRSTHDDLRAAICGRAADARLGIAVCAWRADPQGHGLKRTLPGKEFLFRDL